MSNTIQPGPLKNEQIIHLSSLLGLPPIQMHPNDTALMIRAINLGYVDKNGDTFTHIGRQRFRRAHELPSSDYQLGGDHGLGNRISTSLFRRDSYNGIKDAANSGALYTLKLPASEKTDLKTLKILFDVANTAALCMENNEHAFDIAVHSHDAVMSTILTDTLRNIGLENNTVSDMFYQIFEPRSFQNDGFSLCLMRGHDYPPTPVGFSNASQDGAIYSIPMDASVFSKELMTPARWDLLSCIEFSAKQAANCLDGNSEMILAFAIQNDFEPSVQYVSMDEMKEAYTQLNLTSDPEKTGREPLNLLDACKLAIQIRTKQLQYDLPAHLVDFADKAVNTMVGLSQHDENLESGYVSWLTAIEAISARMPNGISENASEFLQKNLSLSIYTNMHIYERNPSMIEHLKNEQCNLLLTAFAVALDAKKPALKQDATENVSELKHAQTVSRTNPGLR